MICSSRGSIGFRHTRLTAAVSLVALVASLLPAMPAFGWQITADSLVGYWKFDETSVGSFADASGESHTGTGQGAAGTNNTPQPSATVPSGTAFSDARSLDFDGTDDYVSLGDSNAYTLTNATFALWARYDSIGGGDERDFITKRDTGNTATEYQFGTKGNGKLKFSFPSTGTSCCTDYTEDTTTLSTGTWYHLAVTFDDAANQLRWYVNGQNTETDAPAESMGTNTSTALVIGASMEGAFENFDGLLDDVRIYKRALAPWEIAELAAGRHVPAYWKGTAASTTGFQNKSNWSGSYIPDPYSRVVLRAGGPSLTLTGAVRAAGLTINTGALLHLSGTGLTMNDAGVFINYGTLALRNTETLTNVTNDVRRGTVMLVGTGTTTGLKTGNSYYNLTLNDGLVGYWKLDETGGTRVADSSGYGNSGSLVNGPSISATVAPVNFHDARSVSFTEASSQYVSIQPSSSIPVGNSRYTIAAWIYPNSMGDTQGIIGWGAFGSTNLVNAFRLTGNGLVNYWWDNDLTVTTGSISGGWHHVVASFDGTTRKIYLDGLLKGSDTPAGHNTSSTEVTIGRTHADFAEYFDGRIDDVRLYNRSLSAAEIAALAAGNQPSLQKGSVTLDGNLAVAGSLTLNGGTLDVSSSNYNLSLSGSFLNNGGVFTARKGGVTLKGAQSGLEILSGGTRFNDVTLQGSSATWNIRDRLTASGSLTLTSGTLDASGSYVVKAGTWTQNGGTFTPRSGTVVVTNASNGTLTPSSAFNILRVEDPTENGLIGYWKFDEGTNTGAILDSSGRQNTAVRTGTGLVWTGATLPSLAFHNPFGMTFNGSSDYVRVAVSSAVPSSALTVCAWLRTTSASPQFIVQQGRSGSDADTEYVFRLYTGRLNFWDNDGSSGFHDDWTNNTAVNDGVWHHACFVKNGTSGTYYLDGAADGTRTADLNATYSTNDFVIGKDYRDGIAAFNGHMDDVRIYNRSLSANEIMNLARGRYASGSSGTATQTLAGNLTAATLALDSGILSTSASDLTVTNALSLLRGNGSLAAGAGTVTLNGGLNLSGSTLTGGSGIIDINGNVSMLTGSLIAPSGTMTVSGNWLRSGGTFTANGGTLTLDGNSQTISGSLALYNLTKTVASAYTLTFDTSAAVTVSNALTLRGTTGTLLSIRSNRSGTAAVLRLSTGGTQTIDFLDVKDSDASGGDELVCMSDTESCVNSGNNTNWYFAAPPPPPPPPPAPSSGSSGGGGNRGGAVHMVGRIEQARQTILARFTEGRTVAVSSSSSRRRIVRQSPSSGASSSASVASSMSSQQVAAAPSSSSRRSLAANPAAIAERRGKLFMSLKTGNVLYADVSMADWYAPYVTALIQDGIAQGYKDKNGNLTGEFGVNKPVTRAEALAMALKSAGIAPATGTPANFSVRGTWAEGYVKKAEGLGISVFTQLTDVNAAATRGEVVQIVLEALGITIGKTPAGYSDVPANHPHSFAIASATFFGFVSGYPDGTFRPDNGITRAEIAKIIALLMEVTKTN